MLSASRILLLVCFVFAQEPPESIPALMFEAAKDPTMLILLAAAVVSLVCGVVPGVSMRSAGLRTVCSYARPRPRLSPRNRCQPLVGAQGTQWPCATAS